MNESKSPNLNIVLVIVLIVAAFALGHLYTKVTYLEQNKNTAGGVATGTGTNPSAPSAQPTVPAGTPTKNDALVRPKPTDHYQGNLNANVVLIEYSDFQCPFCKKFSPVIKQVVKDYGDKIAVIYRHFPLTSIHPYAQKMAEGSECIAKLGGSEKFWAWDDKLAADTEGKLTDADLPTVAASIGVDKTQFKACLDSGEMANIVDNDSQEGLAAGVDGTPGSFILNIKTGDVIQLRGSVPYAQVKTGLDKLLQ